MADDRNEHHRQSLRWTGYDYRQPGAYFVTICTEGREAIFGEVTNGDMHLNELGRLVQEEWLRTPMVRPSVALDAFVVMPNHVHGILVILDTDQPDAGGIQVEPRESVALRGQQTPGAGAFHRDAEDQWQRWAERRPPRRSARSLGSVIAGFKSASAKRINVARGTPGAPVWQRNYHDRVIRTEQELEAIREYVVNNPAGWAQDADNPSRPSQTVEGARACTPPSAQPCS